MSETAAKFERVQGDVAADFAELCEKVAGVEVDGLNDELRNQFLVHMAVTRLVETKGTIFAARVLTDVLSSVLTCGPIAELKTATKQ